MTTRTTTITRRQSLQAWLAGAGAIGLRAMATGLPISFLVNPRSARAADACAAGAGAQYLILSMLVSGDVLNCNVLGMYDLFVTFAVGIVNYFDLFDLSITPTSLS